MHKCCLWTGAVLTVTLPGMFLAAWAASAPDMAANGSAAEPTQPEAANAQQAPAPRASTVSAADQQAVAGELPPFPYAYVGQYAVGGSEMKIILARNGASYLAEPGSVLDETYRVDAVTKDTIWVTYLPLSRQQRIAVQELPTAGPGSAGGTGIGAAPARPSPGDGASDTPPPEVRVITLQPGMTFDSIVPVPGTVVHVLPPTNR